jgi:SAM-dependent methyltransferase
MGAARTTLKRLKIAAHAALIGLGIDIRRVRPDRVVLERTIFPELLRQGRDRILFVGCDWYTLHYHRLLPGREFWTLESNPSLARFGAPRHVVDSCERVASHFAADSLDAIVCNGVYGFGLDTPEAVRRAIEGFHAVLRPGGLLVFGWNNVSANDPLGLDAARPFAPLFRSVPFPPLGAARFEVAGPSRHTYEFLVREPAGVSSP